MLYSEFLEIVYEAFYDLTYASTLCLLSYPKFYEGSTPKSDMSTILKHLHFLELSVWNCLDFTYTISFF